ncbi:unnamed protein product [Pieris macdunnoughi]|uniref:Uncharacterized protein n=1 Tax=Pieris macdunnoughi TaxID=345717 RepID=A0A821WA66_9NEOP|nr:unnamed protein product [Pieris macdunnoughi]
MAIGSSGLPVLLVSRGRFTGFPVYRFSGFVGPVFRFYRFFGLPVFWFHGAGFPVYRFSGLPVFRFRGAGLPVFRLSIVSGRCVESTGGVVLGDGKVKGGQAQGGPNIRIVAWVQLRPTASSPGPYADIPA